MTPIKNECLLKDLHLKSLRKCLMKKIVTGFILQSETMNYEK